MAADARLFFSIRSSTFFFVLTCGLGMDSFLYAFVVPLLPSFLEHRTNVPPQDIQKAISITLAVYGFFASFGSPFAGVLADQVSRRSIPFLASLAFLAAGTVMFMTVQTFPLLIVARALQGISTATVWTIGLAMLLDRVGASRMGVTMGSIYGAIGAAQLGAPTLGGWLFEKFGIEPLTGIAVGIVVLDFTMRLAVIEVPTTDPSLPDSSNTDTTNETSEPSHLEEILDHHHERAPLLSQEQPVVTTNKSRYPLPDKIPSYAYSYPVLILIRDPRVLVAFLINFTQSFQFSSIDATLPPELASRLGFSSGPISLMILPWIIPFIICDPILGRLIDRIGPKVPVLIGLSSWTIVLLLLRIPILLIENGSRNLGIGVWACLLSLNGIAAAAVGSGGIVIASHVAEGYTREHPNVMIRKSGKGPFAQLFSVGSVVFHAGLTVGPMASGALRSFIGYANMNAVLSAQIIITCLISLVYMEGWPVCGKRYPTQEDEVVAEEAVG